MESEPQVLTSLDQLRVQPERLPPWVRNDPRELLAAVARGLALPDNLLPALPKPPTRPVVTAAQKEQDAALKAWRATEAKRLGVEVSVVLPQRLIDKLTEHPAADAAALVAVEGFRQWRQKAFGPAIIGALRAAG